MTPTTESAKTMEDRLADALRKLDDACCGETRTRAERHAFRLALIEGRKALAEYDRARSESAPVPHKGLFVFNEELSTKLQGLRADMPKEAKSALVRECIDMLREHQAVHESPVPPGAGVGDRQVTCFKGYPGCNITIEHEHFAGPSFTPSPSAERAPVVVTDEMANAVLSASHSWDMGMDSSRATGQDRLNYITASANRTLALTSRAPGDVVRSEG